MFVAGLRQLHMSMLRRGWKSMLEMYLQAVQPGSTTGSTARQHKSQYSGGNIGECSVRNPQPKPHSPLQCADVFSSATRRRTSSSSGSQLALHRTALHSLLSQLQLLQLLPILGPHAQVSILATCRM